LHKGTTSYEFGFIDRHARCRVRITQWTSYSELEIGSGHIGRPLVDLDEQRLHQAFGDSKSLDRLYDVSHSNFHNEWMTRKTFLFHHMQ